MIYFIIVFFLALCGIVYELLLGALSSYLLGDSVFQYSMTIGFFMFSLGLGSYLSNYIKKDLIKNFIIYEIILALFGGLSTISLYYLYIHTEFFSLFFYLYIIIIGTIIGLELPIIIRYIKEKEEEKFSKNLSLILFFDYLGALIGSIIFVYIFIVKLGFIKTSIITGLINIISTLYFIIKFFKKDKEIIISFILTFLILISMLFSSIRVENYLENNLYKDKVIYKKQTPYQKIVITTSGNSFKLFLNGNLQFCSLDEYRYHESLVDIPMALNKKAKNILILGGGDGLAVREVLKHKNVKEVQLVDIDKDMVNLCKEYPLIKLINKNSLSNKKVKYIQDDAYLFLKKTQKKYDIIIIDLPDPNTEGLAKLYTREFYLLVLKHLNNYGIAVTQSTSPYFSNTAFWCINKTIKSTKAYVYPYWCNVPSFGEWGFNIFSRTPINIDKIHITVKTRFLNDNLAKTLFIFPEDLKLNKDSYIEVNTIFKPILIKYYYEGWKFY